MIGSDVRNPGITVTMLTDQGRKWITIARILLVVLCALACLGAAAPTRELPIRFHRQHTQVWCWAATIAMVMEYVTGKSLEDCQVLAAYDRSLNGRGLCCQQPATCNRRGSTMEMAHIMENLFGLRGVYLRRALTFQEIKNQIDSNRPIIAGMHHQQGGHVVVISGYGPGEKLVVLDPLNGKYQADYSTLKQSLLTGSWLETFVIGSAKEQKAPRPKTTRRYSLKCCTSAGPCRLPRAGLVGTRCYCNSPQGILQGKICF